MVEADKWVWVVVLNPGKKEQFLGQHDRGKNVSYIPAFLEKEEAVRGAPHLVVDEGLNYEVQAVQYQELVRHAGRNGFLVFILDASGRVLEKTEPQT
ncbi:MAG: hypothetical protein DRH11_10455 [Deltaproteobacteria bacterium]|nr:hypothetical protein [Deltaproteobacteria bacterium]RLB32871.1 MAG: hypothetical protein DRH11_10455 [Deltaproteobacteria bacterium]